MMRGFQVLAVFVVLLGLPLRAAAGGTEFPADGTRNFGRGGAGMARADDPSVAIRNPALLADLWGDQALLGAHLLIVDSCFQATGGYGLGRSGEDYARIGDEILILGAPPGTTWPDGTPVVGYDLEPYPNVCYQGPAPFLPRVALSMKLAPDLGVTLGFFPPDNASLNQFGNRDTTVDTPNGPRPSPLRYIRSHLNTSYFSVLGAVGYRLADWIRIGFGFQWQLVVFQSRSVVPAYSFARLEPSGDVRVDSFGRDLFVPGLIGSVHIVPFDSLDIALGFKWSDRVMGKTKIDFTSGAFGASDTLELRNINGDPYYITSTVPTRTYNQAAEVSASPIWVPQASLGIRYADRLKPRVKDKDWGATAKSSGGDGEDSMATERWDIELDVIYYMTSFQDRTALTTESATVLFVTTDNQGNPTREVPISAGDCLDPTVLGEGAPCRRRVRIPITGQDQVTFRLGGDYNILPDLFTVRAGASYELDGQTPDWMSPFQYMASRLGLHAGFTVRLARKTDFSMGFAYFIQKDVHLQVNPQTIGTGDFRLFQGDPGRYNIKEGAQDGTASVEIPNSSSPNLGPYYANAGSYFYDLSVLSASISQRF